MLWDLSTQLPQYTYILSSHLFMILLVIYLLIYLKKNTESKSNRLLTMQWGVWTCLQVERLEFDVRYFKVNFAIKQHLRLVHIACSTWHYQFVLSVDLSDTLPSYPGTSEACQPDRLPEQNNTLKCAFVTVFQRPVYPLCIPSTDYMWWLCALSLQGSGKGWNEKANSGSDRVQDLRKKFGFIFGCAWHACDSTYMYLSLLVVELLPDILWTIL